MYDTQRISLARLVLPALIARVPFKRIASSSLRVSSRSAIPVTPPRLRATKKSGTSKGRSSP